MCELGKRKGEWVFVVVQLIVSRQTIMTVRDGKKKTVVGSFSHCSTKVLSPSYKVQSVSWL